MKLLNEAGFRKAIEMIYSDIFRKATSTTLGKIKVGKNLTIKSDGTLEGEDAYTLPKATTSLIGGVKIGKNLTIKSDGTLDAKDQEVDLGTTSGTALEGSKLAETLGIPYGGILNNSSSKVAGTAYYDTTTKKTYKCTSTTSLDYAESTKFEAISNNDLLLEIQNFNNFGNRLTDNLYGETREFGVTYTNNSDKFLLVYAYGSHTNGRSEIKLNGKIIRYINGYGNTGGATVLVPPHFTYFIGTGAFRSTSYWYETY